MNNISIYHLSEDIRSEFTIDEQGRAFASRRAVARLVGVEHPSILKLLKRIASGNLKKSPSLQPFAGQDFSDGKLPDILVAAIIEYYCFDSRAANRQAQLVYRAFATVGFRLWIQQELGWQKPLSQAEYLLSVAQQFVEQERQLKLIRSQINTVESQVEVLAAQTEDIKKTQQGQDEVLLSLVAIQKQAESDLEIIPFCAEQAQQMSVRDKVVLLVRTYCYSSGIAYKDFFSHLYCQFKYRYHYDVKARSRNKRTSLIDQIEKDGMIDALYAVASEIIQAKIGA
ncbi:hypothetical protein PCC7424_2413 [Gloeothece citriformis PCC 7424]|uniref:Uncharacterized protein n=1 Tax=Gloeothece citriformis (strain PCC 7424) TaxID=65393 RepID=B7KIZ8_GLOC7|nr:hypothetical protein [Gloeothece citriformis]ACK70834.1 hypothetical protein PCC7424_2413 [Gloeothece citriformis PCC 7424]